MKLSTTEVNVLRLITRYREIDGSLLCGLQFQKAINSLLKRRLISGIKSQYGTLTYQLDARLYAHSTLGSDGHWWGDIIVGSGTVVCQHNPFRGINPYSGELEIDDDHYGYFWQKYRHEYIISARYLDLKNISPDIFVPKYPNFFLVRDFLDFSRHNFTVQHMAHISSIGIVYRQ